ncbi:type VI secretion system baseplate subunit TssF [Nitrospirillum viridazoti]|uniref:Type VI secretion system ImpG/VasA family protein n=1 Tax=Nitrospirillum viridazoti CBAmc TaxID=1441467 RepID=A0A248K2F4_9PROT|nr:type VI secretion system baseplate subunit TssF [Nitrospirillum amazonense]ASG25153.1 type VI secretion system ImpG/VasA family protein [Nitrospirillum amazonense CBAmc]TWB28264.1 type VI secretion system protein ImpG [Nitrospirillum amazonense]
MPDTFLSFYNQELAAIRRAATRFAGEHPKVAGNLRISPTTVDDPHVARLIESFAYLTARVRQKLDDDFPELTDALLGVLYPHYVTPLPSMAIVQMKAAPELTGSFTVPRGAQVETEAVRGEACRFQTTMPAEIWPVEVTAASLAALPAAAPLVAATRQAKSVLRLKISSTAQGQGLTDLGVDRLRLFLSGPPEVAFTLHELLLNNVVGMAVVEDVNDPSPVELGPDHLTPVGFEPEDGMVPYGAQSFLGYRLLSELFTFPEKFLFVDLHGLSARSLRGVGQHMEVYLYLDRVWTEGERLVRPQVFALGCAPVVNLFRQSAEPIILGHDATEYLVQADARRPEAREIYAIERVRASSPRGEKAEFLPLYGNHHGTDPSRHQHFWHAMRRPRGGRDASSEMYLSLVDLGLNPNAPPDWTVSVETLCFNRDLPAQLPFGGGHPRMHLTEGGPIAGVTCLTPPTAVVRPQTGDGARWRLISHLNLNHLSLVDGQGGRDGQGGAAALRELLKLYDLKDTPETRAIIDSVTGIGYRRATARAPHADFAALCRGVDIDLVMDPERAGAMGIYLPSAVLERFFALYTSINSFTRLTVRAKGRKEALVRWGARIGAKVTA